MAKHPDGSHSDRIDQRIRRHLAAGKAQSEIARLVGVSLRTVERRIRKARHDWRAIQRRAC